MLIYSFERAGEYANSRLIIFDIGLSEEQKSLIRNLILSKKHISFRDFEFNQFPEFVKPEYSTYSWKPIIIWNMIQELKGNILWLDSANIILQKLDPIWEIIKNTGCYTPYSGSGTLQEWTVQETLDYLQVPPENYHIRNRAGNLCGFSSGNETVSLLLKKWHDLALIKECIRPETATRQNHRDDQSLLTILLNENKQTIQLTEDEVNISSKNPNPFISVRHKGKRMKWLPIGLLPFLLFRIHRRIDILFNTFNS